MSIYSVAIKYTHDFDIFAIDDNKEVVLVLDLILALLAQKLNL